MSTLREAPRPAARPASAPVPRPLRPDGTAGVVAVVVWALAVVPALTSVVLLVLGSPRSLAGDLFGGVSGVAFAGFAIACATVGAVVLVRVPGNAIGPLLLVTGLLTAIAMLGYQYAAWGLARAPDARGLAAAAVASGPPGELLPGLFAVVGLCFPDGRLPSPRWRWALVLVAAGMLLLAVSAGATPGPLSDPFGALENPLGVASAKTAMAAADGLGWIAAIAGLAVGGAAIVHRRRHADDETRRQLALVLRVGTLVIVVGVLVMATWLVWPAGHVQARMAVIGVAWSAFPLAVGLAILRHRLYDLDVVVNRAIAYVALTLLLAATYAVTALALAVALGSGSTWATAGATLAVAAAFAPLRGRLQDAVDRRFDRARHEADRRVAAFVEALRAGRAEPEAIEPLLRELLGDPELELRFLLPASRVLVDVAGRSAADSPHEDRTRTPIVHAGEPLGVVLHRPAAPGSLDRLVATGGLAIEMARLRVELRRQLAEVERSRRRIVEAGNAERRRIERDLHDGAQQRLVTIGLELRHAQAGLGTAPSEQTSAVLERAVGEVTEAIAELRGLAHGLPPSQLDAGLAPALHELAARAPLRVTVQASAERYAPGIEAAAYFVACEGLTNAIKHAQASAVTLSARRHDDALVVRVADDGVGGATDGSGILGLRDRIAAHGGRLTLASPRDAGTVLVAELPCGS